MRVGKDCLQCYFHSKFSFKAACCWRKGLGFRFRQTLALGRIKEVNTRLTAKNSDWPTVSSPSMLTIVELRDDACKNPVHSSCYYCKPVSAQEASKMGLPFLHPELGAKSVLLRDIGVF